MGIVSDQAVQSVHEYVEGYDFRFDNGGAYTPTEAEKSMLEDAINGFISEATYLTASVEVGEFLRVDSDSSVLLYTLRQDGYVKGEPNMVNDVQVHISLNRASAKNLTAVADGILSALKSNPVEVVAVREQCAQIADNLAGEFMNDADTWTSEKMPSVASHSNSQAKAAYMVSSAIRALSPAEPVPGEPDFSKSIAEVIKEESLGGAACGWKSCTGCLETNEGYHCGEYPYSEVFKTHAGSGCSECGGIGVVWEYYSKSYLDEMQRDPISAEPVDQWQDIATAPKDGKAVIVYDNFLGSKDGRGQVIARFDKEHGWHVAASVVGGIYIQLTNPIKWMPLPAAPTSKGGE